MLASELIFPRPKRIQDGPVGLVCLECRSQDIACTDSRPSAGNAIRRRRLCKVCGTRFTTYEVTAHGIEVMLHADAKLREIAALIADLPAAPEGAPE